MLAAFIGSWLVCIEYVYKNLYSCVATQEMMYCRDAGEAVVDYSKHWIDRAVGFVGPELSFMIALWTLVLLIFIT